MFPLSILVTVLLDNGNIPLSHFQAALPPLFWRLHLNKSSDITAFLAIIK